jgi:hypothetical protein
VRSEALTTLENVQDVEVHEWLKDYLHTFAAAATDPIEGPKRLLKFYSVPRIVTTSVGSRTFTTNEQVLGYARGLIEGLHPDYSHSEVLNSELSRVNDSTVVWRADFLAEPEMETRLSGRSDLLHCRGGVRSTNLRHRGSLLSAPDDSIRTRSKVGRPRLRLPPRFRTPTAHRHLQPGHSSTCDGILGSWTNDLA